MKKEIHIGNCVLCENESPHYVLKRIESDKKYVPSNMDPVCCQCNQMFEENESIIDFIDRLEVEMEVDQILNDPELEKGHRH